MNVYIYGYIYIYVWFVHYDVFLFNIDIIIHINTFIYSNVSLYVYANAYIHIYRIFLGDHLSFWLFWCLFFSLKNMHYHLHTPSPFPCLSMA